MAQHVAPLAGLVFLGEEAIEVRTEQG